MDSLPNPKEDNLVRPTFKLPGPGHHIKISDGIYSAEYVGSVSFHYLGSSPRVAMCFRILDDVGPERYIFGFYKVIALSKNGVEIGKNQRVRNPDFQAGWRSRICRDLGMLFEEFSPRLLPTSVPPIDSPLRIKTKTVSKDSDGNTRPDAFYSSKVDCIVGWAE